MYRMASRARKRPTREETRRRLFEGAETVFAEQGIGGASVEAIAEAAGFTRGAFYSNFASKDELIAAMLADHVEQTVHRNLELLARNRRPEEFMAALRSVDRGAQDPLGRSPLLHVELLLHAARAAEGRHELAAFLGARRRLIVDIIEGAQLTANFHDYLDTDELASMLLAMEDGFRLHQLIDPATTPEDSFLRSLAVLQQVFERSSS